MLSVKIDYSCFSQTCFRSYGRIHGFRSPKQATRNASEKVSGSNRTWDLDPLSVGEHTINKHIA